MQDLEQNTWAAQQYPEFLPQQGPLQLHPPKPSDTVKSTPSTSLELDNPPIKASECIPTSTVTSFSNATSVRILPKF